MNLLAHALLSAPEPEVRLGNVLADFVKGRDRHSMSPGFLEGVRQHQAIDAFTDSHPVVSRSKARITDFRHVTGILVDIFYDHFLTLNWERYCSEPLNSFTSRVYAEFRGRSHELPEKSQEILERIVDDDWLGSYGSIDGIEDTLARVSRRLQARVGKDFGLARATSELVISFDRLSQDFAEFFPQLQEHLSTLIGSRTEPKL